MVNIDLSLKTLAPFFRAIGLYSPGNKFYAERVCKHRQVIAYLEQIVPVIRKLSSKRTIVMMDACCGRSYLSFMIYAYCKEVLGRNVKIIGIDRNDHLIQKCIKTASELGFTGMEFHCSDIDTFNPNRNIDIIYTLHACDTATDHAIAKGVKVSAKYIFSVSCCQHTNRALISKHPLTKISRYWPYKERIVDMVSDSMRALLLEQKGYGVKIFEFVSAEQTPKNILLRAVLHSVKSQDAEAAAKEYNSLVNMFNYAPKLEKLIED